MSSVAVDNGRAELEPIKGEESAALHEEVDRLPAPSGSDRSLLP